MAAELCLTLAYVGLAFILKNTLKFNIRQFRLPDVVAFLLLVPVGAALSAFIYCGVLYLGGGLSPDKLFVAMVHCWIGDALGIVTIIPAATAAFTYSVTAMALVRLYVVHDFHFRAGDRSWIRGARWSR